jgi:hypothetical protein
MWELILIALFTWNLWWAFGNYGRRKKLEQAEVNLASFVLADIFNERNDDEDGF